jgi:putative transposase
MAKTEAELRCEAVRRRLAGESPEQIGRSLGRSRRWVAKWVGRHETGEGDWASGRKRGPERAPHRTPPETEALVLGVRERLAANPWAQIGAEAIAWELKKLEVEPPPKRTIERIVTRAGAANARRGGGRREPKGVPYPLVAAEHPGDLHEADLVGPRHLRGGVRFYALNAIDRASHRCGIEIVPDSSDAQVAAALVALWRRLGLPLRVQFDNGSPFVAPKGLGLIVRLCLQQGVTPRFVPPSEPWRQGVVEHFNDTFDKRFFRQERFDSLSHLQRRARAFERFHNGNHRYRSTNGRTPHESTQQLTRRLPHPLTKLPHGWPASGRVEFVRFIRSDRKLRLPGRAITMPKEVVYEYVTAVLDLATSPQEENLRVLRDGEIIATATIKTPT